MKLFHPFQQWICGDDSQFAGAAEIGEGGSLVAQGKIDISAVIISLTEVRFEADCT